MIELGKVGMDLGQQHFLAGKLFKMQYLVNWEDPSDNATHNFLNQAIVI